MGWWFAVWGGVWVAGMVQGGSRTQTARAVAVGAEFEGDFWVEADSAVRDWGDFEVRAVHGRGTDEILSVVHYKL